MGVQRAVWAADFDRAAKALLPWTVEGDDGWKGISPNAPAPLLRHYEALRQLGYFHGWI